MDTPNITEPLDAGETPYARYKPRVFRHVVEGTTVATGCIRTKEGDLTEHNAAVDLHRALAMSTRR
jgi:hypothetical protein